MKDRKNFELQQIQIKFANLAGMLASRFNFSPIVGEIYALLYLSPEPVSLNEMVEKLGISKASASMNIRYLETWGAVKKVWVNSSRKDYYEANPDVVGIIFKRLKEGLKKRIDEIEEKFNSITSEIEKKSKDEFIEKRIENLKEIYKFVKKFLESLTETDIKQFIEK